MIAQQINDLGLKQFEDKLAGTYSGGNKRKLSVAIATLGNPPIVFLDEPSTGMDPAARRFMWNVISSISTKSKQIPRSYSPRTLWKKPEALSTRMAIQVSGMLKCLGSIQHIKSKFGGGYEMEIKLTLPTQGRVQDALQKADLRADNIISSEMLTKVLRSLDAEWLAQEGQISVKGVGSALYNEVQHHSPLDLF